MPLYDAKVGCCWKLDAFEEGKPGPLKNIAVVHTDEGWALQHLVDEHGISKELRRIPGAFYVVLRATGQRNPPLWELGAEAVVPLDKVIRAGLFDAIIAKTDREAIRGMAPSLAPGRAETVAIKP